MPIAPSIVTAAEATGARGDPRPEHPCRIWVDDPRGFSASRITPIRHDFHRHPLMQLPRLRALAKSVMGNGQCRFVAPGIRPDSPFLHNPRPPDGRDLDEVFDRIEEPGAWIAIYHCETDPEYRDFLREVIDSVKPMVEAQQPDIFLVTGFIFVSAPPSVTPFHIDRENNFWLQIRGRKTMSVWDHRDREVVPAQLVDEFIVSGSLDGVCLRDGFLGRSRPFDVGPGDGVYFPSTSPHMTRCDTDWVRPGDGTSISIGVNFYTAHTRRSARVHALNRLLRKFGLSPREPGLSPALDRMKEPLGHLLIRAMRLVRGYQPRNGM